MYVVKIAMETFSKRKGEYICISITQSVRIGVGDILTLESEVVNCQSKLESELSEQSQSSRYSSWVEVNGQRDDAASAYVLCPLILSSSQFGRGSEIKSVV